MRTRHDDDLPTLDFLDREFERLARHEAGRRTTHRRRLLALGLSSAVVAAASFIAVNLPASPGSVAVPPAQASVLDLAEALETNEEDLALRGGDHLYKQVFRSEGDIADAMGASGAQDVGGRVYETWTDTRGTIWAATLGQKPNTFPGPGSIGRSAGWGSTRSLSFRQIMDLPRDPKELLQRLQQLSSDATPAGPLSELLDRALPIEMQVALLRAAAVANGVQVTSGIDTPAGVVDALSFGGSDGALGTRWELLLDPVTGSYLGRAISLPNGTRFFASLTLESGVVDELGARPDLNVQE